MCYSSLSATILVPISNEFGVCLDIHTEEEDMDFFWFFLGLGLVIIALCFIKITSMQD